MGTAFVLLLVLTGIIALFGRVTRQIHKKASTEIVPLSDTVNTDDRDKAVAAVVAVTALIGTTASDDCVD